MWEQKSIKYGIIFALSAGCGFLAIAQGPVGDKVVVKFGQDVIVGTQTLPAGEYEIRQLTSASNPRVLEFTTEHGTHLQATATAIPILQNAAPSETQVILDEEGGGVPRLNRIWVQGKNYGYEFPEKGGPTTVAQTTQVQLTGRYEQPQPTVVAQATPPPPPPAREPEPPPQQAAAPEPQRQPEPPAQIAQATPPAETPAPAPAPAPAPTPEPLPATALGWAQIILIGAALMFAGLALQFRSWRSA